MAKIRISGDTSGYVELAAPAVAGSVTQTVGVGYQYVQTVYFTSSGTFAKADYPWLRAIRVKVQGGGGGGGGAAATGAGQASAGSGGAGGGYAERFYTNISALDASVTVTVGSGGAGSVGNATGGSGGSSSFGGSGDAWFTQGNGAGGNTGGIVVSSTTVYSNVGAQGAGTGNLVIRGGAGTAAVVVGVINNQQMPGNGGDSALGSGGRAERNAITGRTGDYYGGGGAGTSAGPSVATDRTGGDGGPGIVIVELYA